jgi:hypothetical protein
VEGGCGSERERERERERESEGVRVCCSFCLYIGASNGLCGLAGWAQFTEAVQLQCPPQLMIYRGGCVRMSASVNVY